MALEITGNIETIEGLTLTSCYARTNYRVNTFSSQVVIAVDYWVNKASYEAEKAALSFNPVLNTRYDYDRTTDGEDVLLFTQQVIKNQLEELGYSVVITDL